jgi:signal transduction histidine kinase
MHDLATGEELGAFGDIAPQDANAPRIRVPATNIELELVGAPHDPFFGVDEAQLVRDLGLHLDAALDRCRMLERERAAATTMSSANVRLQHANAELSELAELRDNFVAIASHELRTPITTIMGFTATLLDLWERIDDAERRDYLHLVDRDARRLGQLVEDLLLLSSVEAADFRVSRERVPIASLLEKVVADMGADAANVDVVLADDDLAVHADPRHVRQAVGNLLANSLKHGAPPIAIRAQCTADYRVRIHVEDHGAGVPEEFRDRLFTRFSRARASEALPGSGLGLFIVQRLVEVQGGRAWLEDVEPSGARFVVELPASAPRTP